MKRTVYLITNMFLCMLLSSCTESCDDKFVEVKVYNNSPEMIYLVVDHHRESSGDVIKSSNYVKESFTCVLQGQKYTATFSERDFKYGIQILVIKGSTMERYDSKQFAQTDDISDKKYVLSYNNLAKMGFVVNYTGE